MEQQLQSLADVVSSLHPYVTDSTVDEVDCELKSLRGQLRDLESETTQIADEVTEARESSAKLQAEFTQFDSKLQAADQHVAELSYMYADELMSENTAIEVS